MHPVAYQELDLLDAATCADVHAIFAKLVNKTHQQIADLLDGRTERKVAQWERSNQAGTLRVVFAWGEGGLWFIGAFVKANDSEGERYMKRILPRADQVKEKELKRNDDQKAKQR
jgi:hypothetical protein